MSALDGLRLTLADIAELARVQRPVVSTWRRRYARADCPFPEPVAVRGGAPRFRASDVVAWIETTGRGNNPAFRADVALRAVLDDAESHVTESARHDGLTALLAIKAYTGTPVTGLPPGEVLDLADELDPEDAFLYRELAALGDEIGRMGELADLAASAAYTPGAAVEALLDQRFRAHHGHLAASALQPAGLRLVAAVVHALGAGSVLADPHPGPGDLLHAVLAAPQQIDPPTVQVPGGDTARLVRRRLVAHGWDVHDLVDDPDPSRVVVTAVPTAGEPEIDDAAVLGRVDDIVLGLHPGQRAVVIGPAGALVEAATPAAESARAALLRTDRLRSVVLLPPGLVVQRPRQRLALWVVGDAHPAVPIADRWTMVADLTSHALGAAEALPRAVLEDLLTDIVAALGTPHDVRAHAFRFSRFVRVPELLARGGSLATAGRHVVVGARDDDGAAAVTVSDLAARQHPALPERLTVERGPAHTVHRVPLGTLADRRRVRRIPGNRIDDHHIRPGATGADSTRVIGVPELLGDAAWGTRVVDTLDFVGTVPAARLTEPGDVVFCTAPHPAAAVDVDGFSVVQYPARVLRVTHPSGHQPPETAVVVPEVLAADIAAQPPGATWWRTWEVRLVPEPQADAVGTALRSVHTEISAARRRITDLETLAVTLTDGVTAGVVRLRQDEPTPTTRKDP